MSYMTILTSALMLLYSALALAFQVRPVKLPFAPALQLSNLMTGSPVSAAADAGLRSLRRPGKSAPLPRPALPPSRKRLDANRTRTHDFQAASRRWQWRGRRAAL